MKVTGKFYILEDNFGVVLCGCEKLSITNEGKMYLAGL
jgi:hypothetical protein